MAQSTMDSIQELLPIFSTIFTRDALKEMLTKKGINMYWRAYTPLIVLWGFLFQRLHSDQTCDNYVAYLQSGQADSLDPEDKHGQPLSYRLLSESNSGYVQGRNRMPLAVLQEGMRLVNKQIQRWLGDQDSWQGHAIRFIDGTTFNLQPQGDLAETYGHSSNQRGKHYWVKVRSVAGFDLVSQAAVAVVEAPYSVGETSLVEPVLREDPERGAIYIGDRNFGVYRVLQAVCATAKEGLFRLQKQQWQSLMRRNSIDHLGPGESCPCVWCPSPQDKLLQGMPAPAIDGRLICIRIEEDGFPPIKMFLFTTLCDEKRYPVSELAALYARRYAVAEGGFRHLKTTMQLDNLSVRSVAMFRKELIAACLAYNLVCALMTLAAKMGEHKTNTLSFVKAKRRLCYALFVGYHAWGNTLMESVQRICQRISKCRQPSRLYKVKHEPRRKRYRWRRYPPLTTDRQTARQLHLREIQGGLIS